jgi:AcrR family transcriptional regulator
MAVAAPRWTRLERDERREQILATARRLFSGRHFDAVSTAEIANAAGVTRGLLHHYFGSKRDLYLEVLRSMVNVPPALFPEALADDPEEALSRAVDRWLEMVQRNRATWLATVGAQGFGSDPEVEAILEEGRERTADSVIAIIYPGEPADARNELRALVRAYAGFAEAASLEWLVRRRLSREQTHELLLQGLLRLYNEVLPAVERAANGKSTRRSSA